jgi:hypothetical protein
MLDGHEPYGRVRSAGVIDEGDRPKIGSIFTIGTLFGVALPLYAPAAYEIRDQKVIRLNPSLDASDYVLPAVFVMPSVGLYSRSWWTTYTGGPEGTDRTDAHSFTISLILPAGMTTKSADGKDLAIGLGVSFGWTVPGGAEVGLALATVWQQAQSLNGEQQSALDSGGSLADGASNAVGTKLKPSLTLGAYIAPTF